MRLALRRLASAAVLVPVMTLAPPTRVAQAQWPSTPTASETAEIAQGKVVVLQQDVDGVPWPRVRLYRFIDATPEQSVAMFADYEHQRAYNVDIKEARIAQRRDPATVEVFYHYASNVPMVSDVTYTVLDQLHHGDDGSYDVGWTLLSGSKTKSIEGRARFSPWMHTISGRAGTLLTYDNFVVPDFPFSSLGFVRRKGVAAMRDAVDAIALEVERELREDRPMLDRQVTALRAALNP